MKKSILIIMLFVFSVSVSSQNVQNCGTDIYWENMIKIHPEIKTNNELINKKIKSSVTQQKSGSERVYYIPVVFHVVYDTPNKNIPDNVLINALENLNNNFRKRNNTPSVYSLFQNLAADCKIEFFLAKKNLDCNSISGITRHQVTKTGFDYSVPADDDELKTYGYMDSKKYLNAWICDITNSNGGGVGGYAPYPGGNALNDGIVLDYANVNHAFTHEIGHWLNLKHIWGNTSGISSTSSHNCNDDDDVSDTPQQFGPGNACSNVTTSCGSVDNCQNYMDYGSSKIMFTHGQKARMRAVLENAREELICDCVEDNSIQDVLYSNTNNLPAVTAANTITTQGSVTVQSGQTVVFEAGTSITLNPGFVAEAGSNFTTKIKTIPPVVCYAHCEPGPVITLLPTSVTPSGGAQLCYEVENADWYEVWVYNLAGQLVNHNTNFNSFSGNNICVWYGGLSATGYYNVTVKFKRYCNDKEITKSHQIFVVKGMPSNKMAAQDSTQSNKKSLLNSPSIDLEEFDFTIYPNPTNGLFYVAIPSKIKKSYSIEIINSMGKTIKKEQDITKSVLEYNTSFSKGVYFVKIIYDSQVYSKKIIIQ